jgi:hypothetical protein
LYWNKFKEVEGIWSEGFFVWELLELFVEFGEEIGNILFLFFFGYLNKSKEEEGDDEVEEIFNLEENRDGCDDCGDCDGFCNGDCGILEISGVNDD